MGDTIGNVEIVKLWNLYTPKLEEVKQIKEAAIDVELDAQYNDKHSENVEQGLNFLIKVLIYLIGFWEIANGRMTIGGLFAFATYSSQITIPISVITKIRYHFADIKPSMERFLEFLEIPEENQGSQLLLIIPNK